MLLLQRSHSFLYALCEQIALSTWKLFELGEVVSSTAGIVLSIEDEIPKHTHQDDSFLSSLRSRVESYVTYSVAGFKE